MSQKEWPTLILARKSTEDNFNKETYVYFSDSLAKKVKYEVMQDVRHVITVIKIYAYAVE